MKGQDRSAWWGSLWLSLPLLLGALCFSGASHASWDQDLYRQLGLAGKLDSRVFRKAHGRFQSLDEVAQVPGVTQDMIDEWQGLAYVS
jgi:hypothetical protein